MWGNDKTELYGTEREKTQMEMTEQYPGYDHRVQYYETDQMGCVHHSNYIRWFEEARHDYLKRAGFPYEEIEARGIIIPVLTADCEYKAAVRFGEKVKIVSSLESFNGLRFELAYHVYTEDGTELHASGHTGHCFLDRNMRPVNIKKKAPDIYECFCQHVKK